MKKVVKLKECDFRESGLIVVCYDDESSKIESIDINPKGKEYQNFAAAKGAIMLRIWNRFGRKVQIDEALQSAINDVADTLATPIDKEEGEALWAAEEMRDIEEADARRERWLHQRG